MGNNIVDTHNEIDLALQKQSYFLALSAAVFPRSGLKGLILMLHAFVDESGTHKGSQHHVVAGYIATVERWNRFNNDWGGILSDYNLTEFHCSEFYSRFKDPKSPFRHIERPEEGVLLDRLAESIIGPEGIVPVGGILPMDAYEEEVRGRHESLVGQPYTLTTNIMLMAVKRWANEIDYKRKHRDAIAFFFEIGAEHSSEMFNAIKAARNLPEFKNEGWLGGATGEPYGPQARGLEAADFLAHTLYVEKRDQLKGIGPYENLARLSRVPPRVLEIDSVALRKLIAMRLKE